MHSQEKSLSNPEPRPVISNEPVCCLGRPQRRRLAAAAHLEVALAEQAFSRIAPAEQALQRAEAAAGLSVELTGGRLYLCRHL